MRKKTRSAPPPLCSFRRALTGSIIGLLAFLACRPATVRAQDTSTPSFTLAPGESHWLVENCQAEFQRDGLIRGKKGDGWIRSVHSYDDFALELDWKPEKPGDYDAGVFFRAAAAKPGEVWPDFYQVNLKPNSTAVLKNVPCEVHVPPTTVSSDLIKPGDWNHLKLHVQGKSATCEVNGKQVWSTQAITAPRGFIAQQVEEPKGGVILYRNLKITELGHHSLLGKGLEGWEPAEEKSSEGDSAPCWQRDGNELLCTGAKGPWLRYSKPAKNFNLRLDYMLKEGGNSGVYIRVPKDGNHHGASSGIEVQLLDDASPRYSAIKPYQFSASLYAIVPADPRNARPHGQWNSIEIECREDKYSVWQNGAEVIRASGASAPELSERRLEGYLGLQNHSEEVRFRNIRLKSWD